MMNRVYGFEVQDYFGKRDGEVVDMVFATREMAYNAMADRVCAEEIGIDIREDDYDGRISVYDRHGHLLRVYSLISFIYFD